MEQSQNTPEKMRFGSIQTGETAKEKERKRRKRHAFNWAMSTLVCLISFAIISAFSLLTIYLNDPVGWLSFLKENVRTLVFMELGYALLLVILFFYYGLEKRMGYRVKDGISIALILFLGLAASYFVGRYISVFARPVLFLPLLLCFLRDKREAHFLNFVFALFVLLGDTFTNFEGTGMSTDAFASFLLTYSCGTFSVFLSGMVKTRLKTLLLGIILLIPVEMILAVYFFTQEGEFLSYEFVELLVYGALGVIFSVLLFTVLLPLFEIIFSRLTVFRLRELTGFDVKLLKRLREEAPATFDHSLIVASFAESCAAAIGENAELARAAATYHDVGKLSGPSYFTENQKDGVNPHDFLPPEVSVEVIRKHTRYGQELIQKNHLPDYFGEVALRHHGTMPIRYFYVKARSMSEGEEVSLKDYSYQDGKPKDKITAIIMICDSCEAAIRSFRDNVTRQRSEGNAVSAESITSGIEAIIKKIVDERIELDQFSECDITIKELSIISTAILNSATGVYHGRIAYPELNIRKKTK